MNKIVLILLSSFVLFSCNEEKAETKQEVTPAIVKEACNYSLNPADVKFEWTAFKTTAKVAVKGTFDKIEIFNEKASENISDLILNTEFTIHLESLNSANEERDQKIIELFFGKLSNKAEFVGQVTEVNGDNENGSLIVRLNLNGKENLVKMVYKMDNDHLKMAGDLDLLNWNTENSFEALNAACKELHTGEDGVSKTWTDVHIEISTLLNKDCK